MSAAEAERDDYFFNTKIDNVDAWFIIEGALDWDSSCVVPRNRVFFLSAETARPSNFFYDTPGWEKYLSQFAGVYTPLQWNKPGSVITFPFLPWMINANHGPNLFDSSPRDVTFLRNLQSLPKDRMLSVICSNQRLTAQHRTRFWFVTELKKYFGSRLDWFGNGVSPISQKWSGLAPYRYSIVLENQASSKILTEKIQDAYLTLTLPIYWGAPEAATVFGKDAVVPIQINDVKTAIAQIEQILEEDPYEEHLASLLHAKSVVTDDLNFIRRIQSIVRGSYLPPAGEKERVYIQPVSRFTPGKNATDLLRRSFSRFASLAEKWES